MALTYAPPRWPAASATVLLWGLAAASTVFWGLRLSAPADSLAPPAVTTGPVVAPDPVVLSRLLGGTPSEPVVAVPVAASSRFALLGVVADSDGQGAALIAIDGKPPRPFRVGRTLADGFVLQSVTTRGATVGAGVGSAPGFSLQLPVRPMAPLGLPPVVVPQPAR